MKIVVSFLALTVPQEEQVTPDLEELGLGMFKDRDMAIEVQPSERLLELQSLTLSPWSLASASSAGLMFYLASKGRYDQTGQLQDIWDGYFLLPFHEIKSISCIGKDAVQSENLAPSSA
ncbi:MAG TPA: hypothetical protein PKC99_17770 [Anaerolineales bacterium]|nr:hypothetical protein [Anaerolineales bacterium]